MMKSASNSCRLVAVTLALALLPAINAFAEFRVLDSDENAARRSVTGWSKSIEFLANPQRARSVDRPRFPYTMSVTDEETGEIHVVEGERPEGDPLAERTVILTRTLLDADELTSRVEVLDWLDGTVAQDADASDAVTVRPFAAGTALRGIEIIARPALVRDEAGELRTAGRIRIDLDGPDHAAGQLEISPRAMQDPLVQRLLDTSVLNPQIVRTRRSGESSGLPLEEMPQPVGNYRMTYKGGNEVFIVPFEDIGITWGARGLLVLDHHGDRLPRHWTPDQKILFYAPRHATSTDNDDSVFTRLSSTQTSPAMRTRQAFTTMTPPQTPGEATERGIQRSKYKRITEFHREFLETLPLGNRFVSPRIDRTTNNTRTYNIPIHDIPTNGFANLRVITHGDSAVEGFSPDHIGRVRINSAEFQSFEWNGFTRIIRTPSWSSVLPVGEPLDSIGVTYQVPTSVPEYPNLPSTDFQHLESLEVTYLAKPRVGPGFTTKVSVVAGDQGRISVGGFPSGATASDIILLDVTNPKDPEFLLNHVVFPDETGGTAVHFQAPTANRTFHVQYVGATSTPGVVEPTQPLPDTAEMDVPLRAIYVRKDSYADALAPLVNHRGPGVVEITPQMAYDTFSGGQQSPAALKEALKVLIDRAPEKVAFPSVMLVGHGSFDQREISGKVVHPQIPGEVVPAVPVPSSGGPGGFRRGENMVDYRYATLFGDDDYPDVRLGRVPVRNAADVTRFVDRLLKHEDLFGGPLQSDRPLVLAAGRGLGNEPPNTFIDTHRNFVEPVWDATPYGKTVLEYDGGGTGTNNFVAMKNAMESGNGASFILYLGHGNLNIWQGVESFLRSGNLDSVFHLARINSTQKWPIAVNFTCASGRFMVVGRNEINQYSIAETLLHYINPDFGVPGGIFPDSRLDNRGAVAALIPVGFEFAEPMVLLEMEFVQQMAGENSDGLHRPLILGDEWVATQFAYIENVVSWMPSYQDSLEEFILFGDPDTLTTLVSPLTEFGVAMSAEPKTAMPEDEITLKITVHADEIGDEARGIVAEMPLPAGLEYIGASVPFGSVTHEAGVVRWHVGSLLPGVEITGDVVVRVTAGAHLPLESTVAVTAFTEDFDASNNSASVTISPIPDVIDSIGIY